jgi:hypothetical protein
MKKHRRPYQIAFHYACGHTLTVEISLSSKDKEQNVNEICPKCVGLRMKQRAIEGLKKQTIQQLIQYFNNGGL